MTPATSLKQWPLVKRLFELWNGDLSFRRDVEQHLDAIARVYGLCPDSLVLARKFWQDNSFTKKIYDREEFPALHAYREHREKLQVLRGEIREACTPLPAKFKRWRSSQINRCNWQLGTEQNSAIIHMPICFELSSGCSVGCWFCGLNAQKLSGIFSYTRENSRLWQEVLTVCHEVLGRASSRASLYWATEPFDNPDYERFCLDFHSIFDLFPQTTTALALADIPRTRSFLQLSNEKGCELNRFSVYSSDDLLSLHKHFTATELAQVDLILQNRGSLQKKAGSGRLLNSRDEDIKTSTISCTSGFLVNMVQKNIKLISPCPADATHPVGYQIFAEGFFYDAGGFSALLHEMIESSMQNNFSSHDMVQLTSGIQCIGDGDETIFSSSQQKLSFSQSRDFPRLHRMIGRHTAGEIAAHYLETGASEPALTFMTLNSLLHEGILQAEVS